jgi:hypothetical protein
MTGGDGDTFTCFEPIYTGSLYSIHCARLFRPRASKVANLEVGIRCRLQVRGNANTLDRDDLAGAAGDSDVKGIGAEAAGVLKEVVGLARGRLPGGTAVDADLEGLDGLVGIDNLHGEPVR